jgi:hypothetical protein
MVKSILVILFYFPSITKSTIRWKKSQQINVREYRRGNQKRTIQKNRENKVHKTKRNTTQYVLNTTNRKQTQITQIRREPSYIQLEVKTKDIISNIVNKYYREIRIPFIPWIKEWNLRTQIYVIEINCHNLQR